jgi:hypothetical protein
MPQMGDSNAEISPEHDPMMSYPQLSICFVKVFAKHGAEFTGIFSHDGKNDHRGSVENNKKF